MDALLVRITRINENQSVPSPLDEHQRDRLLREIADPDEAIWRPGSRSYTTREYDRGWVGDQLRLMACQCIPASLTASFVCAARDIEDADWTALVLLLLNIGDKLERACGVDAAQVDELRMHVVDMHRQPPSAGQRPARRALDEVVSVLAAIRTPPAGTRDPAGSPGAWCEALGRAYWDLNEWLKTRDGASVCEMG